LVYEEAHSRANFTIHSAEVEEALRDQDALVEVRAIGGRSLIRRVRMERRQVGIVT
jgi:hypothetical protein